MKKHLMTLAFAILLVPAAIFGQEGAQNNGTTESGAPAPTVTPKATGTIRIGLAPVRLAIGPDDGTHAQVAEGLRVLLADHLKGPTVEVVTLESKTATNMAIECRQKECDALIAASLSKKTRTSLFGSLVQAALPVVANQASASQGSGDKTAIVDSSKDLVNGVVGSKFGAKDEIVLDLQLVKGGAGVIKQSFTARPKADGQDVMVQLVEQGSEKVLQTILK